MFVAIKTYSMTNKTIKADIDTISKISNGRKILFASFPADGHFNPLTGLAVYLKSIGYDVRWYTSDYYAGKTRKLGIPHYGFVRALDIRGENIDKVFPERKNCKGTINKLNFDLINGFIKRAPEFFADIEEIHTAFPFDLMIADGAFCAIPFVKEKMKKPVIAVGIFPLAETSTDLPPNGLGMTPSYSFAGRIKQAALRWVANNALLKKSNKVLAEVCKTHGIRYAGGDVFNFIIKSATLVMQSGTAGFEYERSDRGSNIRFIGPLVPHTPVSKNAPWFNEKLNQYEKVILVTQGSVEKDVEKLLVPALRVFRDTNVLVVAVTGGTGKDALRVRFPQSNLIIEDFIPFEDIMPYADVFITNGGYGGVLLAIENELPIVAAGVHEGKNEINARIGFFKLGIDLKTEKPRPSQIRKAVGKVLTDRTFKRNVSRLATEFSRYHPNELCARYVNEILQGDEKMKVLEEKAAFTFIEVTE
ncbi:MAG: glycosyl transferase [Segetibacter sp.]|nr:glycosyl transferase [Segetibacter sp.]